MVNNSKSFFLKGVAEQLLKGDKIRPDHSKRKPLNIKTDSFSKDNQYALLTL
jgi:hypothetical protein